MSTSRLFRSLLLALVAALALGGLTAPSAVAAGGRIAGTIYAPNGTTVTDADLNLLKLVDGEWEWYFDETYTDETGLGDGKYEFTGLPAGSYKIEVSPWEEAYQTPIYHDGTSWIEDDAPAFSVGSSGTVTKNVTMKTGRTVSGHLTVAGGAPAIGTCEWDGDVEECPAEAWAGVPVGTDGDYRDVGRMGSADPTDGSYTITGLPATTVRVCSYGDDTLADHCWDDQPTFEEADDVSVVSQNRTGIDIELPRRATVTGVVTDGADPIEGVGVMSYSLYEDEWTPTYDDAETDENGEFTLRVKAGAYRFCFDAAGYADECFDGVESVEEGSTQTLTAGSTTDLGTIELDRGSSVSGTLRLGKASPKGNAFYVDAFKRQTDGSYEYEDFLEVSPNQEWTLSGLGKGTYKFAFSDDQLYYGTSFYLNKSTLATATPVTVDGEVEGVDATLQPGGSITGKVTGPSGAGQSAYVWVHEVDPSGPSGWAEEASYYGFPASSGTYTVKGLPAGDYVVEFVAPWTSLKGEFYADAPSIGTATSVKVTAGKATSKIDAQLTTGGPTLTAGTPTISSSAPAVGKQLTASEGTWKPKGATFTYQWLAAGAEIDGATAKTFTPTPAQIGKKLSVRVTGTAGELAPISQTSAQTKSATAKGTLTGATPTIDQKKPKVDQTLTATPGTWSPDTTLSYQWRVNGKNVTGATDPTYQVTGDDLGKTVDVVVKGVKDGYTDLSKGSAKTSKVAAATLTASPIPTISGTAAAGGTLEVDEGIWGPGDVTLKRQWYANGKAISGATGDTLVVRGSYEKQKITVTVTGSKKGYTTVSRTSLPTGAVGAGTLQPQEPVIVGADEAAVGRTLTLTGTDWTPIPGETVLKYQWQYSLPAAPDVFYPIPKATAKTYTLTAADLERYVRVTVVGSAKGFAPASAERVAAPTEQVAPGTLTPGQVKITLPKSVTNPNAVPTGTKLTGSAGTWGPKGAKLTYAWHRAGDLFSDGVVIPGSAGKTTYTTTAADKNQRVIFTVTASLAGYTTVIRTAEIRGPEFVIAN